MYDSLSVNEVSPALYKLGSTTLNALVNSPAAQAAGIGEPFPGFVALYGSRATVAQALRPFPQYHGVGTAAAPYANSTYNSFQLKVDKRFSHGLTETLAYTYSKMLSNGGPRPNLTGAPLLANNSGFDPNVNFYLNTAAFSTPAPLTFGNAPVYLPARQPNFKNESFGVFKDTKFTERATLQFRMEMSNPLNRVVFGAPVSDLSARNFGRITSVANSPRNIQFELKMLF
jgi:hypothetical protein